MASKFDFMKGIGETLKGFRIAHLWFV